jgi:ribosomal protein S1
MGTYRVPKPPDYMMNPGGHTSITNIEKMTQVINEINAFVIKIDEERNNMYVNLMKILEVPDKYWGNKAES